MKGCGWMTYHLAVHTIIVPMSVCACGSTDQNTFITMTFLLFLFFVFCYVKSPSHSGRPPPTDKYIHNYDIILFDVTSPSHS